MSDTDPKINDKPSDKGKKAKSKGAGGIYGFSEGTIECVLGVGSVIAAMIGAIAFFFGAASFCISIFSIIKEMQTHGWIHANALSRSEALIQVIDCVEMFIAAPLPYLVVRALYEYISEWGKLTDNEGCLAHHHLKETKLLVFSLLLSLVAVDFVSDLIGPNPIKDIKMSFGLIGLIVLGGYILLAEMLDSNRQEKKLTTEHL